MAQTAQAQDVAAGENLFKKCLPCHSIGEGAKNKVGPELNGIDGRHSGTAPGYNYSDANKNSGITWNEKEFLDYIKDPRAKIKGTKMIFPGIKNETEAKNLWAYLASSGRTAKRSNPKGHSAASERNISDLRCRLTLVKADLAGAVIVTNAGYLRAGLKGFRHDQGYYRQSRAGREGSGRRIRHFGCRRLRGACAGIGLFL